MGVLFLGRKSIGELIEGVPRLKLSDFGAPPAWPHEETALVRTVRGAWGKWLEDLSGHELRTLVSQGFGLEHLAETAVRIVQMYPLAEFSHYSGELAGAILRHHEEFALYAPSFRAWLNSDLSEIEACFPFEDDLGLTQSFHDNLRVARERYRAN
jgi:hypothetical protein